MGEGGSSGLLLTGRTRALINSNPRRHRPAVTDAIGSVTLYPTQFAP